MTCELAPSMEVSLPSGATPREVVVAEGIHGSIAVWVDRRSMRVVAAGAERERVSLPDLRLIDLVPVGDGLVLFAYGSYRACPEGGRTCLRAYSIDANGRFVGEPVVAPYGSGLERVVSARVVGDRVLVRLFGSTGGHSWADVAWIFQRLSDGTLLGEGRIEIPSNGAGDSVCHTRVDALAFDRARVGGLVRADPEWLESDRERSAIHGTHCEPARLFVHDEAGQRISTATASVSAPIVDATFEGDTWVALVSEQRGRGVVIRVRLDATRTESTVAQGAVPPPPFDTPRLECTADARAVRCDARTLTGVPLSDQMSIETGARRAWDVSPIRGLDHALVAFVARRGRTHQLVVKRVSCR